MTKIDLNCDMGEGYGIYTLGPDKELIPFFTSVSLACGFHASDPSNMRRMVALAKQHNAAVGAHPSFPDHVGFGLRALNATPEEITSDIIYQIGALMGFCFEAGIKMQHVKIHGALYNLAETDLTLATAIAEGVKAVKQSLIMICRSNSAMVTAAKNVGVPYVQEAFGDRAYTAEGLLVSRKLPGALVTDADAVGKRVLDMVKHHKVTSIDGAEVPITADTICIHGDTPGAINLIKRVREVLAKEGIEVRAFGA